MKLNKIPLLSFFTGGGFLDLGFEEAGFETVWSNEFNEDIADIYEHGITSLRWKTDPLAPMARISTRKSITDLDAKEVLEEAFKGRKTKSFGVIGGPPCPDFSVGGKNRGHEGDHGKLSQSYIDMVCALQPSFFLMENVPGLIRTAKHRQFLERLRKQLRDAGYATDLKILNSLEYGVPQDRERIFMIGLSSDTLRRKLKLKEIPQEDGWFPYPEKSHPEARNLPWPDTSKFGLHPPRPDGLPEELMLHPLLASNPPPSELPNGTEGFVAYSGKFKMVAEGDDSKKSFKKIIQTTSPLPL